MGDNKKELIETMEGITIGLKVLSDYLDRLIKILKDKGENHEKNL